MTCARHEDALLDAARGAALDVSAAGHVASCRPCASWLEEQRALTAMLQPLAAPSMPSAPPLPAALREHLRATSRTKARRRPGWLLVPAAVAAALAWFLLRAPEPAPPSAAALPMETTVHPTVRPSPSPVTPAPVQRPVRRARPVRAIAPTPEPEPERTTRFVRVPYSEAYGAADDFQLVRVAMPRSALVGYGWPAVRDPRPVTADVLVGSDGLARAIRLVETR